MFSDRRLPPKIKMPDHQVYLSIIVRLILMVILGTFIGAGAWYVWFSGGFTEAVARFSEKPDDDAPVKLESTVDISKDASDVLPSPADDPEEENHSATGADPELVQIYKETAPQDKK